MKQMIFRFTLPLTLISFALITKWWYGIAIDAKDVFFYGFPLIYKCEGFHTSLSTQYFLFEAIINLVSYFTVFLIITLVINRLWRIRISRKVAQFFWIALGIFIGGNVYLSIQMDDRYKLTRDFDVEIFDWGITFLQTHSTDREKYNKELTNWREKHK
jgi:hypothetical protein